MDNDDRWQRAPTSEVIKRCLVYLAMVLFCIACWWAVIAGCCRLAHASPLDCEQITQPDQRHYCRAVSIPRKSECELIKDNQLRYQCRALVR